MIYWDVSLKPKELKKDQNISKSSCKEVDMDYLDTSWQTYYFDNCNETNSQGASYCHYCYQEECCKRDAAVVGGSWLGSPNRPKLS